MIDNIYKLRQAVNKWLYIRDEEWLDLILACSLDRKIKGDPLWLFIVAVPSSTKTEILRCFKEGDDYYHLSSLTANSFVSGLIQKGSVEYKDEKGKTRYKTESRKVEDMANQVNEKILILKDFTSVLSMAKEKRDEIIGQLRELYDGYYSKKFGTQDKKVEINTSFGLIAGVTPEIDRYYSIMGKLGERFLKLRSDFDESKMLELADINEGKEKQMREEITKAISEFIDSLKFKEVKLSEKNRKDLKGFAKFLARMRAPSNSRWEGSNMVEYIPSKPEKGVRLYKQLIKLTKCLCLIHEIDKPNDSIMKVIWRIVKDSSPPDRMIVYDTLLKTSGRIQNIQDLSNKTNIPRTTLKRILFLMKEVELIGGEFQNEYTNEFYPNQTYIPPCLVYGSVSQEINRGVYIPKYLGEESVK